MNRNTRTLLTLAALGGAAWYVFGRGSSSSASMSGLGDAMTPWQYWQFRRAMRNRGLPDYNSTQQWGAGARHDSDIFAPGYAQGQYYGPGAPYGGGWQPYASSASGGGMYSGGFPPSAVEMETPDSISWRASQIDAGAFV